MAPTFNMGFDLLLHPFQNQATFSAKGSPDSSLPSEWTVDLWAVNASAIQPCMHHGALTYIQLMITKQNVDTVSAARLVLYQRCYSELNVSLQDHCTIGIVYSVHFTRMSSM